MGSIESRNLQLVEQPDSYVEVEGDYRVHFEGGYHASASVRETLEDRLERGYLNSFSWKLGVGPLSSEISQRLSRYQPLLLGLDGHMPNPDTQEIGDLTIEAKKNFWISLPDFPSKINKNGSLIAIKGDSKRIRGNLIPGIEETEKKEIDNFGISKNAERRNLLNAGITKETGRAFGAIGASILSIHLINKMLAEENVTDKNKRLISRRQFLRYSRNGLIGAGAGLTLGIISPLIGPFIPNTKIEDYLERIANLATQYFSEDTWNDGRTAILTAKTMDALKQNVVPSGSDASIIMGNRHSYKARNYLSSESDRRRAIQNYAEMMLEQLGHVTHDLEETKQNEARSALLDYIASMDLVSVKDPGVRRTDQPYRVLDDHIKYLRTIYSPEILDALEKYR